MKRKTKLHRDTLRRLTHNELRRSAGRGEDPTDPLKSGKLTCGGETVDTCDTYSRACYDNRTYACTDGYRSC